MLLHSPVIIQVARPEIVEATLTLISIMRQGACFLPFYLFRQPTRHLWTDATTQPFDCWPCKTINCRRSIDAHLWAHLWDILTIIGCWTIIKQKITFIIGREYTVSLYYCLNPGSLRHFRFWATTIHIICMMIQIGPLRVSAFSRQFTA